MKKYLLIQEKGENSTAITFVKLTIFSLPAHPNRSNKLWQCGVNICVQLNLNNFGLMPTSMGELLGN